MTPAPMPRPGAHPAPSAETPSARRADIQGLRAVAVLMVVAFHARLPLAGGFTGVDVFFVISGYVITAMLAREWQSTGRIDLRRFYLRRALRLLPALALTISFVMLASVVLLDPFGTQQETARTGLGALLLHANLSIARAAGDYFAPTAAENPLLHTWSLSVEEQFYLIYPAAMIGAFGVGRALGRPWLAPAMLLAGSVGLSLGLSVAWAQGSSFGATLTDRFGGPAVFAFYGLPTRIWEFGVGGLIALAVQGGLETSRGFREAVGTIGLALVCGSAVLIDGSIAFPGWVALGPVGGTALLLIAGTGAGSTVSRLLSTRPWVVVGDWSYSIYLWHWPLIALTSFAFPDDPLLLAAAAAFCFVPAWLSYRRVEQPLRTWRPAAAGKAVAVLLAITLVPMGLARGLVAGAESGWGGRFVERDGPDDEPPSPGPRRPLTRAWRSAHAVVAAGCVHTELDPVGCRFGPQDARGWILLVGDSQAYAVADGLIAAAEEMGHAVVASSQVGCPFVGPGAVGYEQPKCAAWQDRALAFALESRPAAVVIANRSASYIHPKPVSTAAVEAPLPSARALEQAAAVWRRGVESVIEPLQEAGIPVLIVASVAAMPRSAVQRSIFAQAWGGEPIGVPLSEAIAYRLPADEIERAIAERHAGVRLFDPFVTLCGDVCPSARGSTILYQDATHLSLDGALLLAPALREALAGILPTATATGRSASRPDRRGSQAGSGGDAVGAARPTAVHSSEAFDS